MIVFCNHQSESQCIAHMALMSTANPQNTYNHMQDASGQWMTFWDDGQIQTKEAIDEDY